jgi:enoyl-CoA hydratase
MPEFEFYQYEAAGPLATVTLNNPTKFNIMGAGPWKEMHAIQDLIEDDPAIRVVIIKAAGPHFSAGINLKELLPIDAKFVSQRINYLQRAYNRWQELNAISIAAVNGMCFGSAFEMCTCFDIRVASEDARFSIPEVRFGLSPDMGASQRLPRLKQLVDHPRKTGELLETIDVGRSFGQRPDEGQANQGNLGARQAGAHRPQRGHRA